MKGIFDDYVLWPLAKRVQNWTVDRPTAPNFTVVAANFNFLHNKMNFCCGNYSRKETVKMHLCSVYYSILNSFGQRSQYISIKFPLHKLNLLSFPSRFFFWIEFPGKLGALLQDPIFWNTFFNKTFFVVFWGYHIDDKLGGYSMISTKFD